MKVGYRLRVLDKLGVQNWTRILSSGVYYLLSQSVFYQSVKLLILYCCACGFWD